MIRVLIVDDHTALCTLFKNAFGEHEDFTVIGELSDANLAYSFCKYKIPDLILMDVCADGKALGLYAARDIKKSFPKVKIIMMSGFDEISFVPRAKALGADAFFHLMLMRGKGEDFAAARSYLAGRGFGGDVCKRWNLGYAPGRGTLVAHLRELGFTNKEMMILRLLCQCKNRKDIAKELNISENTVKYHIMNMLSKTGFETAAELAIFTVSGGWINPRF